jgi:hypothetical protein
MTAHCWADVRDGLELWESIDMPGATCFLPDGHDGPHEFTPDSEVVISFALRAPGCCTAEQADPDGIGRPHRCALPAGHEGNHDPYPHSGRTGP